VTKERDGKILHFTFYILNFVCLEQNKTQEMLSQAAGISRLTLSLLERGETVTLATFMQDNPNTD